LGKPARDTRATTAVEAAVSAATSQGAAVEAAVPAAMSLDLQATRLPLQGFCRRRLPL